MGSGLSNHPVTLPRFGKRWDKRTPLLLFVSSPWVVVVLWLLWPVGARWGRVPLRWLLVGGGRDDGGEVLRHPYVGRWWHVTAGDGLLRLVEQPSSTVAYSTRQPSAAYIM